MVWWGTLQGGVGARVQLHALGAHGAGRGLHGGRGRGGLGGGAAVHLARRARAVRRRRAARLLRRRQVRAVLSPSTVPGAPRRGSGLFRLNDMMV